MTTGQIVLLVYAGLLAVGALMGYRAGSKASLIAGGANALLLVVAWWISRDNLAVGLWIGAVISLLVSVMMGRRLAATKKVMPSGMVLVFSLVALVVLAYSAATAGS